MSETFFFSLLQTINVCVCPFVRNISSRVVYSIVRVLGYLLIFFFYLIRTVGWFNIISTEWFYANTWVFFFLQNFQWVFFQRHPFALDDPLQSLIHYNYTEFYPIFSAMLFFFNCFLFARHSSSFFFHLVWNGFLFDIQTIHETREWLCVFFLLFHPFKCAMCFHLQPFSNIRLYTVFIS